MNLLILLGAFLFCQFFLHELGHYLTARRIGTKNIKLKLLEWHRIPYGIAVTGNYESEIDKKHVQNIVKFHIQLNSVALSGILFESFGIALFTYLGIFPKTFAYLMMLYLILYGFYEATSPGSIEVKK